MIKAILFDCFGVLTTDTWRAFVDSLPADVDMVAVKDLSRAYNSNMLDRQSFLDGVRHITGRQPQEVESLLGNEIAKNRALLEYIGVLKSNYKIAMVSNISTNWIRDSFLTAEELALFDELIFSFEVGMAKPDGRIFMLACERLRVGPHEAVMIDDIESYVEAAKSEGLNGVVYQDLNQLKTDLETLLGTERSPYVG